MASKPALASLMFGGPSSKANQFSVLEQELGKDLKQRVQTF